MQFAGPLPRRIFLDGTLTLRSAETTGVERVVRSLIREVEQQCHRAGMKFAPVVLGRRGLEPLSPEGALPEPGWRDDLGHYLPPAYIQAVNWLCGEKSSSKFKRRLLPKPGHLGAFRLPVWLLENASRARGQLPRRGSALQYGPDDLLLLPDGYWGKMEVWEYAAAARAAGAFTAVVIYDLIPLTHPRLVPKRTPAHFTKYLRQAVKQADLIMTISKTVCEQLQEELPKLFPDIAPLPAIDYFHLGADFPTKAGSVRDEVARAFQPQAGATPYITVSTFNPRKNHGFTLDAFEHLWQRGLESRLVYIGGRGWMCNDLLDRLQRHPRLGERVFVFHGLSDSELSYCYQHARGAITSSAVEGFGLPIIESLWHGRRMFASDTPIHREVGGEHAEYFSLASPVSLAERIQAWEQAISRGEGVDRTPIKPMDWRESTEMLLAGCLNAFANQRGAHFSLRKASKVA